MGFVRNSAELIFKFKLLPTNEVAEFPADLNAIGSRFTPSWDNFMEVGRGDAKILLNSYGKEIDLDWNVVAGSTTNLTRDVDRTFDQLETLSKATTPYYGPGPDGYQGIFVEFTLGRLYVNQIGYIVNLQYNWENDKISWINGLPVLTRVNMTLAWIGRRMPQSTANHFRD